MAELTDDIIHQLLVDKNFITEQQYTAAREHAHDTKEKLINVIIDRDLISLKNWGQLIAKHLGYPFIYLTEKNIDPQILYVVPEIVARSKKILAFDQGEATIKLAMNDPSDLEMINLIEKKTGIRAEVYFALAEDIDTAANRYHSDIIKEFESILKHREALVSELSDTKIISLVEKLLSYAHQNSASDIHIEPHEQKIVIRFRIDGIMHFVMDLPKELQDPLITRIKVMAKLKTDEHRSAQDGRMSHSINDDKIDIRVSIVPIIGGEKIVMRLLSDRNRQFTLSNLGMDPKGMEIVHKHANRSFGMILVTGPTGSGKSTTLYAIIKTLNSLKVNIATIEDPIEYDIEGVNQIQVNSKTNLTFVSGLKSILRQDPDIIMLGEIRDDETASLAINAALTGHLLLSTLHTNDAATTMPRLEEMKVTRYLITSAVSIIISQRLIRRLCTGCLYTYAITPEEQDMMAHNPDLARWLASNLSEKKLFFKAKGCKICHSTGYAGRVGIFEILEMSEEIRKIILTGADAGQIRSKAITLGMKTMLEDGMDKVLVGQTTYEEVIRAISM